MSLDLINLKVGVVIVDTPSCIIRGNEVKRSYSCSVIIPLGTLTDGFKLFDKPNALDAPIRVSSADSKIPKEKI